MNSKKIIKALEKDGWYLVATKGGHNQYKHPSKQGRVTVPPSEKGYSKRDVTKYCKAGQTTN